MLKKSLFTNFIMAGLLIPLSGMSQPLLELQGPTQEDELWQESAEEQEPQVQSEQESDQQQKLNNILISLGMTAIVAPIVLYGANYIHELAHKYTGQLLTGTNGTLKWSWMGTPGVEFQNSEAFTPLTALLTLAAGPAAGIATGYGVKKIADKYFHKYTLNSKANDLNISSTLFGVGCITMLLQSACLIPLPANLAARTALR